MLIRILFGIAFLLLAIAVALFYLHFGWTSNLLEVRLDSLRGLSFISGVGDVWAVLAVAGVINLINTLLASALLKRQKIYAFLLPSATIVLDLLILIYISVIITNN